jgi:hypothetical protein
MLTFERRNTSQLYSETDNDGSQTQDVSVDNQKEELYLAAVCEIDFTQRKPR